MVNFRLSEKNAYRHMFVAAPTTMKLLAFEK
jgi:hypothetical protein